MPSLALPQSQLSSTQDHLTPVPSPEQREKPHYPSTFVPACHTTLDACNSATFSCTGHGSCKEKRARVEGLSAGGSHTGGSGSSNTSCWSCACVPTVEQVKTGGRKVTEWTGTSCQKRDVSVQFILLAGFSILMVAAVTWAVGLLYSMGAEELPSVIGAGVALPKGAGR